MEFKTKMAVELSANEKESLVETQKIVNAICIGFGTHCECCPLYDLCEHLKDTDISEDLIELFNKTINILTR